MIKQEMEEICPGKGSNDHGLWAKMNTRERENEYQPKCPTKDYFEVLPKERVEMPG
jgi:hypothetical protein